ncbi:MAG: EF-Tu/IF-2/RF-3 family GTPase [Thermoplasmata archaeon]
MAGISIAIIGARDIAKEFGKKGTASDVTLFNQVTEGHAVTCVEPTNFPEKAPPLFIALGMADRCLLVIVQLSRPIAATIAVADLYDVPTTIVLGPAVGEEEVRRLLKGTRFESAPRSALDFPALRQLLDGWTPRVDVGPVAVPIDHAFPVKGVGAVALGVVRAGTLHAHEKLRLWPTPKLVEIRSIQVHDVEVPQASCGDRVGVALKGVDPDELARGQILAPEGSLHASASLRGVDLVPCPYHRTPWGEGAQMHLVAGLQVVPVSVGARDERQVLFTADRDVAFRPDQRAYVLDLSTTTGPRIAARVTLQDRPG